MGWQKRWARCDATCSTGCDGATYSQLITVDFPNAITGGLRRQTDMVRGVLERTRGDLTTAVRQEEMKAALRAFGEQIGLAAED
jgi:hypothetical protein